MLLQRYKLFLIWQNIGCVILWENYTLLYNINGNITINLKIIQILFGYLGKSLYLCNVVKDKQHLSLILKRFELWKKS